MPDSNVAVSEQDSLTIEYALTRREIFLSFWRSLAQSPPFRRIFLFYAAAAAVTALVTRAAILRSFTTVDVLTAVAWGLGCIVLLSVWVTIRGKTSKRTLTVSSEGISTEIGRLKSQTPWAKIKSVDDISKSILIALTNGNAFFTPNRAFLSPDHRNEFLAKISTWTQQSS
jgi:hypothetical protein